MIYIHDEDGNIEKVLKPEPPKIRYQISVPDLKRISQEDSKYLKEGDNVVIKDRFSGVEVNGVWKNGKFVAEEG